VEVESLTRFPLRFTHFRLYQGFRPLPLQHPGNTLILNGLACLPLRFLGKSCHITCHITIDFDVDWWQTVDSSGWGAGKKFVTRSSRLGSGRLPMVSGLWFYCVSPGYNREQFRSGMPD